MNRVDLLNDIEENKIENIYLLYGRETYLLEELENKFIDLINPDMKDFNLSIIDGKETDIESIRTAVETLPFMDERRYVIIKDLDLLLGKKKNFTEADEQSLIKLLDNFPDTSCLIFIVYGQIDSRKSIVKKIKEKSKTLELKKLEDIEILRWCQDKFSNTDVSIQNSDIAYFIELSGYRDRISEMTLSDMENEINKLVAFVGKGNTIDKNAINQMLKSKSENDIFLLIDYIANKNSKRAYKVLEDLMENGESVLGILARLSKNFNQVLQVKDLNSKRLTNNLMIKTMGIHPFTLNKLIRQSKNYEYNSIISILNSIAEADYKIKNGLMNDRLCIEIIIAKYCK
ncbi:DNA polymerase III subunit delta [Peptostreptococcus equinus]|uniref:DNA polymerase III subunit delta n=1 Tax=Peptostreptococcus equinus TaxID=3003601 RepID=A0ABY7JLG4_9FIRM|nr:DNA polymerase III subunit delta [Peptostreptococcus sp. CBA3647]WAW14201.1 DNA polymerase III subunit delta [Peptostreptococcus sp. CBA3647]